MPRHLIRHRHCKTFNGFDSTKFRTISKPCGSDCNMSWNLRSSRLDGATTGTCTRKPTRRRPTTRALAPSCCKARCSFFVACIALFGSSPYTQLAPIFPVASAAKTQLTWVNGIGHELHHMDLPTSVIADLFGGTKPKFCHNPTAMTSEEDYFGYLGDLTQAGTQKLGRITAEVDTLVGHLREELKRVGPRGRIVHIAHSQGALITSLAAKRLDSGEMQRIEVIAFGGAAALRRCADTPFARCVNYYAVNDPLLALVPSAEKALRSGFLGVCSRGLPSDEPEFVFLTPRGGDPILDHGLLGPTYLQALEWEGRRFQRLYQPISHRAARAISIYVVYNLKTVLLSLVKTLCNVIVAFILFVKDMNTRMTAVLVESIKCLIKPFLLLIAILDRLFKDVKDAVRVIKGKDKFEPIQIPSVDLDNDDLAHSSTS